jgi:hypothetical protein
MPHRHPNSRWLFRNHELSVAQPGRDAAGHLIYTLLTLAFYEAALCVFEGAGVVAAAAVERALSHAKRALLPPPTRSGRYRRPGRLRLPAALV